MDKKTRSQMSQEEATRSPIFLLQRRITGLHYETESVWYSREESEQYLKDHQYNFRNSKPNYPGGRVYCVPCYGELSQILDKAEAAESRETQAEAERDALRSVMAEAVWTVSGLRDQLEQAQAERDEVTKELVTLREHHACIIMTLYAIDHDVFGPLTTKEGIAELLKQRDEARRQLEQAQARIAQLEANQHDPRVPIEIKDPRWDDAPEYDDGLGDEVEP